jgi:hypothetical protein
MPTLPEPLSSAPYPDAPPPLAIKLVLALRRVLLRLAHALVPPEVQVFELATGVAATKLLQVAATHRIADALADGPRRADELAAAAALDADALHRALRALAYLGIFRLRRDGRFENNRAARALLSGQLGRTRQACEYLGSASNVRAWNDLDETIRTGRNAFERVHGRSIWDWFEAHADERAAFADFMMGRTVADAPLVATLYPFAEVKRVCDVGGGRGTLLSELLVRHRHLEGMLCDSPGVIDSARTLLAQRGLADRVSLHAGSFFASVPRGADAYLLKNILHDWDDARSRRILDVVRAAMEPGARLILVELITERNDSHGLGALSDVQMMTVCSEGRERGRAELETLLQQSRFVLRRIIPSPMVSLVEAVALAN